MPEWDLIEQLDTAVDAVLAGRGAAPSNPELSALVAIAADLRDLPAPHFKATLKWKIVPRIRQTIAPHFRVDGVEELITFLEQAFGGREEFRAPRPDKNRSRRSAARRLDRGDGRRERAVRTVRIRRAHVCR